MKNYIDKALILTSAFASMASAATTSRSTAYACSVGSGWTSESGFSVNAYSFPPNRVYSDQIFNAEYMEYYYRTENIQATATGIGNPEFWYSGSTQPGGSTTILTLEGTTYSEIWTSLFDMYVPITNVALEFLGYFLAPVSGIYTLLATNVDDSAMIFFGEGAFDCCTGDIDLSSSYLMNGGGDMTGSIYLKAGEYYPVRIVFVQRYAGGRLDVDITLPDETTVQTFDDFVFQLSGGSLDNCAATTVSEETTTVLDSIYATYTSEIVYTANGNVFTDEEVVYGTPPAPTTTSTTAPWTNTFTSTSTKTSLDVISGITFTKLIDVVETPESTITIFGTAASTYTSVEVETVGSSVITTPVIVHVSPTASTATEAWTETYTSTLTTVSVASNNGTTFTENLFVVETPEVETTVPWTGSETTTLTGYITVVSKNTTYTTTGAIIETPEAETTIPWTGTTTLTTTGVISLVSGSSTYTTTGEIIETPEIRTTVPWTGSDSTTVDGYITIVSRNSTYTTTGAIIKTPEAKTTIPWTGTTTLTTTGVISLVSGSSTYTTTGEIIKTPEAATTIAWAGTYTTTVTGSITYTSDGEVYTTTGEFVKIPEVVTTVPWAGSSTLTTTGDIVYTSEGTVYTTSGEIVKTPEVATTIAWTETYTTTVTGYITYTVSDSAHTTTGKIVKVPEAITTAPWSGSFTTTVSGPITYTSKGEVYTTNGDIVKIPTQSSSISDPTTTEFSSTTTHEIDYVTVTSPCSSSTTYTSETVYENTNGGSLITSTVVIVGEPTVTVTVDCSSSTSKSEASTLLTVTIGSSSSVSTYEAPNTIVSVASSSPAVSVESITSSPAVSVESIASSSDVSVEPVSSSSAVAVASPTASATEYEGAANSLRIQTSVLFAIIAIILFI